MTTDQLNWILLHFIDTYRNEYDEDQLRKLIGFTEDELAHEARALVWEIDELHDKYASSGGDSPDSLTLKVKMSDKRKDGECEDDILMW